MIDKGHEWDYHVNTFKMTAASWCETENYITWATTPDKDNNLCRAFFIWQHLSGVKRAGMIFAHEFSKG